MAECYVYVLRSAKDKGLYIGLTFNLENRIKRHNNGYENATKNRIPFNLLHYECFASRAEARKREKYFKSGIGRETLKELLFE